MSAHYHKSGEPENKGGPRGVWVRIPVIPTINDDEANQAETIRFVKEEMNGTVRTVELLGYHQLGGSKSFRLGRTPTLGDVNAMPADRLTGIREQWEWELIGMGIQVRSR